ncbi:MAG: AraC family transcriptional regulator [Ruthenibacterium sp.]
MQSLPDSMQTFVHAFDIRIFIDHNEGTWHMPMEWHTAYEIFIVRQGSGSYTIGDKRYTFQEGDVFVINNTELHKSEMLNGMPFDALVVMFYPDKLDLDALCGEEDVMNLFYVRQQNFCHRYTPCASRKLQYDTLLDLMLEEYDRPQGYNVPALTALLVWFLIDLNRAYHCAAPAPYTAGEQLKHKKIISEVLDYINEHYSEEIKLSELADRLYINQSYLCREFKKSTGFSLTKYIANKRIREARELLRNTQISVAEVAITVGYNNITHFNWIFKKETGISPSEFRKQLRGHSTDKSIHDHNGKG